MSRMRKKQIESVSNVKKYIAMGGMKRIVWVLVSIPDIKITSHN